ncbi:hypothetical protein AB0I28_22945 [Phytomonospora sp. NPDC050363]|uniref:hypothetical protein n=1 Tax=Phytomonospora sp. NPDC050363 TaxID=3155642 RepID=UPI0034045E49
MSVLPPRVIAELVASVPLPEGARYHDGPAMSVGSQLRALAADLTPAATYQLPGPVWERAALSVTPGTGLAVIPGRDALTAVAESGEVLWTFPHTDWNSSDGSGSAVVTADGRHVWATVLGPDAEPYGGDLWVVLDARTGALLAEATLGCAAAGSEHHLHPDGEHVALSVGEGQDAAPLFWGRLDGGRLVHRQDGDGRVLIHISPETGEFYTVAHYLEDASVHRFAEGAQKLVFPGEWLVVRAGLDGVHWSVDYSGGFVDAETLLVALRDYDKGGFAHLLVDAVSGDVLGLAEYAEAPRSGAYPQGDGTWLTVVDNLLCRWKTCG